MILNLAVGGEGGGPVPANFSSATMLVDYVRVWLGGRNYYAVALRGPRPVRIADRSGSDRRDSGTAREDTGQWPGRIREALIRGRQERARELQSDQHRPRLPEGCVYG